MPGLHIEICRSRYTYSMKPCAIATRYDVISPRKVPTMRNESAIASFATLVIGVFWLTVIANADTVDYQEILSNIKSELAALSDEYP